MTLDEAQVVAAIASTADNGCETCVNRLRDQLQDAFPAFIWTYQVNPDPRPEDDEDAFTVETWHPRVISVSLTSSLT